MVMTRATRLRIWAFSLIAFGVMVYLLRSILLPFVAGMAIAYFLDPMVLRMQKMGMSRTLATTIITLVFFSVLVVGIGLIAPLAEDQITTFIHKFPDYAQVLLRRSKTILGQIDRLLSEDVRVKLHDAVGNYAGTFAGWAGQFITGLLRESLVIVNILSLIFITPVVTFYFLRDWIDFTQRFDAWLPRPFAPAIRKCLGEIDEILAGFVRGQALVCFSLALYYGAGLTVIGLELGLVVGLASGILSFVPYLGMLTGLVVAMGLALAQAPDWNLPILVGVVFAIGNVLEGNVLSPKLVGERIGLHPVWIIFAILAGGALFGFLGILLALPMAAVIGVVARLSIAEYLKSPLFTGDYPEGTAP